MKKENFGFDTINVGHGSGGLMTRELLDKIISKTFINQKNLRLKCKIICSSAPLLRSICNAAECFHFLLLYKT